ncbi:hypothetical protein BCR44DRAFT_1445938 [Catenaria anguillulae PL171]|uniref:NAD-dependent epimerase/dehydratase domain-containing protein n=1 Tax=Catenaria anguillulae PL171 TaxID=765915 RepID=A0A1Y2H6N0_9FUNG|nr:hypothetical protein BCR44DRAFT_1445938 [Catenaria anguillulae PL171]
MKHLLVVGGTGLIGTQIVRSAALRGWSVTSLSRKGQPIPTYLTPDYDQWSRNVTWASGSALDPDTAHAYASTADAIVHSVGLLFTTPELNALVNAPTIREALSNVGPALFRRPAAKKLDFASVQFDMIKVLAQAAKPGATFAYVSAEVSPLMKLAVNPEYLRTKALAEDFLIKRDVEQNAGRGVVVRPGIVSSIKRPFTWPLAVGGRVMAVAGLVPKVLTPEQIGAAVVRAVEDDGCRGVLGPDRLAQLAGRK